MEDPMAEDDAFAVGVIAREYGPSKNGTPDAPYEARAISFSVVCVTHRGFSRAQASVYMGGNIC
jgi:hypothetical protein